MWVPLALALLLLIQRYAQALLAPFKELGVYYIIIGKMLTQDVAHFVLVFAIFLVNYGIALFLTAPHFTLGSSQPDGSWHYLTAIQELMQLGLLGDELPVDFADEARSQPRVQRRESPPHPSGARSIDLALGLRSGGCSASSS